MIDEFLVRDEAPGSEPLRQCVAFALELERLKGVDRAIRPKGLERHENAAEHSWQAALFALMTAPVVDPGLDAGRVAQLLLVHDLGEIDAGDQLAFIPVSEDRANAEAAGARRLGAMLPPLSSERLVELWHEFDRAETAEARFAQAIDRVMPVLQNLANGGQSWRDNGISRARVELRIGPPMRSGAPGLWDLLEPALEEAERLGFFGG